VGPFVDIREKYFAVFSVKELFESFDSHTVIDFIKEIHFIITCNACYSRFILTL